MGWKTLNYHGKLALTFGWVTSWLQPQRERSLAVSPIDANDAERLIGLEHGEAFGNNIRFWKVDGKPVTFVTDATGWHRESETKPIPKPRKRGTWRWEYGEWRL